MAPDVACMVAIKQQCIVRSPFPRRPPSLCLQDGLVHCFTHIDPTHMIHPTEERGRQEWIAVPRSRERQIEPFIRSGNTKCGVETWSGGARRTGGSQQLAAAHHGVAAAGTGPARCRGPSASAENHGSRGAPLLACLLLRLGTVGVCRRGWGSWLLLLLLLHRTRSRTQRGLAGTVGED